jgi:hypothetical protein
MPSISDDDLNRLTNLFKQMPIEFLTDPKEIREAYTKSGIDSCMSYCFSSLPAHPSEVYANCDSVAVAVLKTATGRTVSRAVVNTADKLFHTVYGDYSMYYLLEKEGYTDDCDFLNGCVLQKIAYGYDSVVMPYLDGEANMIDVYSDHIVVTTCGEFSANGTNGYIDTDETICEHCSDIVHDGETYTVEVDGSDEEWCEYCNENNAVYAAMDALGNGTPCCFVRVAEGNAEWSDHHDAYLHEDIAVWCDERGDTFTQPALDRLEEESQEEEA